MAIFNSEMNQALGAIEHEHDLQIIGAWNTGSRAWGLSHPDSDHDIAFIYAQPLSHYQTMSNYTASLQGDGTELDSFDSTRRVAQEDIDFEGWDIKRFLELLADSNATAMEALNSPISYSTHPILDDIRAYVNDHFEVISLYDHYRSFAKTHYYEYLADSDRPTVDKNLYTVRACLLGLYILETHEYPPLNFNDFLDEAPDNVLDGWDVNEIRWLAELKQDGEGARECGTPFNETIESQVLQRTLTHTDHVRSPHEFSEEARTHHGNYQHKNVPHEEHPPDGYTCWPPHCNGHTDSIELDRYVQQLIQSTTLFQ
ncbi:DNA polymerase beta superfamily protein [Halobaculum sp. MBLA0147]|uniref:nucleotidyltransferase domain-containing protein n=1 Tax=Halobaculum sp. MBLA0147 TaxID=3079934 RepID=UPI003526A267